jgi:hypothetical protein
VKIGRLEPDSLDKESGGSYELERGEMSFFLQVFFFTSAEFFVILALPKHAFGKVL